MITQTIDAAAGAPLTDTRASAADTGRLLTLNEVAHLLRVDPRTVTRWAKSGRVVSIRTLGYGRRFLADEVHALLRTTT